MFLRNDYFGSQPFLLSCYFTKIFVHLSVITGVCYFDAYKLVYPNFDANNPANTYLFKH